MGRAFRSCRRLVRAGRRPAARIRAASSVAGARSPRARNAGRVVNGFKDPAASPRGVPAVLAARPRPRRCPRGRGDQGGCPTGRSMCSTPPRTVGIAGLAACTRDARGLPAVATTSPWSALRRGRAGAIPSRRPIDTVAPVHVVRHPESRKCIAGLDEHVLGQLSLEPRTETVHEPRRTLFVDGFARRSRGSRASVARSSCWVRCRGSAPRLCRRRRGRVPHRGNPRGHTRPRVGAATRHHRATVSRSRRLRSAVARASASWPSAIGSRTSPEEERVPTAMPTVNSASPSIARRRASSTGSCASPSFDDARREDHGSSNSASTSSVNASSVSPVRPRRADRVI